MIQYRGILELNFREVSQRAIATSVGNSSLYIVVYFALFFALKALYFQLYKYSNT